MTSFKYETAFQRNIGWVTTKEQSEISKKRIAIGGLGGVGGSYLITLSRLGFAKFNISDLDSFDLSNFNRQYGASLKTIGESKISVMEKHIHDINPNAELNIFPEGINKLNYIEFLKGADLYLDSLDLYATPLRKLIFDYCYNNNIPIVTAAPIGMTTSLLIFTSKGMSPREYFGWKDEESVEQHIIRFLVGVSPRMKAIGDLIQEDGLQIANKKLPSLALGIEMSAAVACSAVLKILLNRGEIKVAPYTCHFDAFNNEQYFTYRPFGARNPLTKLVRSIFEKRFLTSQRLIEKNIYSNNSCL